MTKLNAAIWVIIAALHLAVIARAILLAGRDPYARAAWLLLLIALPFVGLILYVLFGEPWTSKRFRQRGRLVYEELLPFAPSPAIHSGGEGPNANAFRTFEGASRWPTSTGNLARLTPDSDTAIAMPPRKCGRHLHSVPPRLSGSLAKVRKGAALHIQGVRAA